MKFSYCKFCNNSKKELDLNSTVANLATVQIERELDKKAICKKRILQIKRIRFEFNCCKIYSISNWRELVKNSTTEFF